MMDHKKWDQMKRVWRLVPGALYLCVAGLVWAGVITSGAFVNGPVRAMASAGSGSALYMGGDFNNPAQPKLAYASYWSGSDWLPVCGGGLTGPVKAIAVSPNGSRVIVAGSFTSVGGVAGTNHIAECSGGSWKALGSGLGGEVNSLSWVGNDLYAGGEFTTDGAGSALSRVGRWDGNTWSALGSGVDGSVLALAPWKGGVVVGGDFNLAGGVAHSRLVWWSGAAWSALGTAPDGVVRALTLLGSDLVAGGDFGKIGSVPVKYVGRYNGATWSKIGTGLTGPVHALAGVGPSLCAGGEFIRANGTDSTTRFAVFDGASWRGVGPGSAGMFPRMIVRAVGGCGSVGMVGGDFKNLKTVNGGNQNQTARWSFSGWEEI